MNSQTHLLISAAVLAQPDRPLRNTAVLLGAIVPDASIYALVIWARLHDVPESSIWAQLYWQDPWQTLGAISNSVPIFGLGLLVSLAFLVFGGRKGSVRLDGSMLVSLSLFGAVFFASCLLHIAFDFPVHASDAHRHFWPITDWRFYSPFSYWDSNHYGNWISVIELLLGLTLIGVLFQRFKALWVRLLLALGGIAYIAVPLYWFYIFRL